jgi:glycerol-3-phosphate acyltransferase PlsY
METGPLPVIAAMTGAAYLLGSIPFGALIARRWGGVDLRRGGSGNIGATNVARLAGWRPGVLTLLADTLKGALPTALTLALLSGSAPWTADLGSSLAALAAFAGHLWPLYTLGRGGGKGVATALGVFLVLAPLPCLVALGCFLAAALLSRRASAGSLAAAAGLPLAIGWGGGPPHLLLLSLAVMAGIILRHEANIRRLIAGTEPPFRARR